MDDDEPRLKACDALAKLERMFKEGGYDAKCHIQFPKYYRLVISSPLALKEILLEKAKETCPGFKFSFISYEEAESYQDK